MHVPHAITSFGDAMPGFGIVAAVLGVIITMGSIGGAASEIGEKVGRRARRDVRRHPARLRHHRAAGHRHPEPREGGARLHVLHPHRAAQLRAGDAPMTAWSSPAATSTRTSGRRSASSRR
jgi:hypothetical protein